MRKSTLYGLLLCLVLCANGAIAQSIKGRVLSASGAGLPGANVLVKGTNTGASTNADGSFTINAAPTDKLVISYIGYVSQEVTVGNQTELAVTLAEDASQLGEVVVTALGIEREKKALGYNIQELKGAELTQARPTNLVNALSGKIAGVQVTGSNGQPGSTGNVTVDYGNGASAINPDDIETISVLKGANAAALYGSRAANGVILITTKSGKGSKGLGISGDINSTFDTPFRLPNYQNEYGQGFKGQFAYVDGKGVGTNDGVDESWGPKLDGRLIPQFN